MPRMPPRNGWGDVLRIHQAFRELFKQHLGVNYAIATSSCTGALHMGMAALGIGPGDEVILADTNWIATAAPIAYLGAKPVFVDILPDTWCLDPARSRQRSPREQRPSSPCTSTATCAKWTAAGDRRATRHPGNRRCRRGHRFIYHGRRAAPSADSARFPSTAPRLSRLAKAGCSSPTTRLYEHVLTLSNHGRARGQTKQFWPDMVGFKYKMSNIQAAIGCAQIERIEESS